MANPRRLVEWPWVFVEVECSLCRRCGRYRLARLAERYGAAAGLGPLLVTLTSSCKLPKFFERTRQYEARCGARFRVPTGGPVPQGLPAREVRPDEGPVPRRRRRYEPEGPPPTIATVLAEGCTALLVYCTGRLTNGYLCHHQGRIDIDDLGLPAEWPFRDIARTGRLRCSRCGSRDVEVRPDRPDPREVHARHLSGGAPTPQMLNGVLVDSTYDEILTHKNPQNPSI